MNELIKITEFHGKKAVSARELYEKLGFDVSQWSRWYKKNLTENPFAIDGQDYFQLDMMSRTIDFALSIDFAKKLSMMARTEAGEKIRQYFIEVEKVALTQLEPEEMLLQSVQLMIEQKKRINIIEKRVDAIEARTTNTPNYFAIMGYARNHGIQVGLQLAANLGKKAKAICREKGYSIETYPDPRFGRVNLYPISVLDQVFQEHIIR